MGMTYENQRVHFDKLVIMYNNYVSLYKAVNNGSAVGIAPFDEFYWRMTYYAKYQDRRNFGHSY